MTKVHLHSEELDGSLHSWCGRGEVVVSDLEFGATLPKDRCKLCDRERFPNGQPDWHFENAIKNLEEVRLLTSLMTVQEPCVKVD